MAAYSARTRQQRRRRIIRIALLASAILTVIYFAVLDFLITSHFEGSRWQVPSRVYARPLELYSQQKIDAADIVSELSLLSYKRVSYMRNPGEFAVSQNFLDIYLRKFSFWDGDEPKRKVRVVLNDEQISHIVDLQTDENIDILRLEPMFIGAIYPRQKEDRVLVSLKEVPESLKQTLLLVEDKSFYEHNGISIKSILRALWVNIQAGEKVQGGSTITQQLVKNFYLSSTKSYFRKINEAFMSLLLELHYEKDEILEAYINEIYLGQEGSRSIHGFGLASQFYFSKSLTDLGEQEIALLVALVKGASFYDPRRHSQRALERRNLILQTLYANKPLEKNRLKLLQSLPLGVTEEKPSGVTPFPAFIDVVKRQLVRDYDEKDLHSEGLRIFTTLDPLVQRRAEASFNRDVTALERIYQLKSGELETAAVISRRHSAEIQAVIGGSRSGFAGLNRAVAIDRSIGSLVKPVIYLHALETPEKYHLASMLEDAPVEVQMDRETIWAPKNYDNVSHGSIPMYAALAQSYNLAAVKLGLELGVDSINETLHRMGISQPLDSYPANLLGAIDLSPMQVAQLFQTLADSGYLTPLRAIRSVTTGDGRPLSRYDIETKKVVADEQAFMMHVALQNVVKTGTASALNKIVSSDLNVAGKTGTTNDKRDSWFAGYGNEFVGVVWLGRDDFQSTPFSGSTGAMRLWGGIMSQLEKTPLQLEAPLNIEFVTFDPEDGKRLKSSCYYGVDIPVVKGSVNLEESACLKGNIIDRTRSWIQKLF
ncbi:MAG: penicillin-binding protein 1B [Gammaproteobacteria bacterium]|nr:penicillin-binding protein 1B [Gammaproteobacteria bacterium]